MPRKKYLFPSRAATKAICISSLLAFFLGCTLPPQPFLNNSRNQNTYSDAIRYSKEYLEYYIKKTKTVGMAVAVVDSNRIVYSEGFGYADKNIKKLATDSTTFMIGSISKVFTAIAIMQLVEQGLVVLDSPITTYLPEFKVKTRFNSRAITVRDLLTHESGLPCDIYNGFLIGQGFCPGSDTIYRIVPGLFANENIVNPPRTVLSYSNIAFSLLGNIIDRVSNRTYSQYIQDSIFTKLGLNHTAAGFDNEQVSGLFSKGYIDNKEEAPSYIRDISSGNIVTNVLDFSVFMRMLFSHGTLNDRHILDENTIIQMWTPQNADVLLDFGAPMGLGFGIGYYGAWNGTTPPIKFVGHSGYIPPYHSCFSAIPEVCLGVIVFTNSSQGDPGEPTVKILETFYEAKTGKKYPVSLCRKEPLVYKISKKRLSELAGFYQTTEGITKSEVKGNDLVFSFYGKTVYLIPHSDSTFSIQYKLFGLIPIPSEQLRGLTLETHTVSNRKIVLVRSDGNIIITGEKFEPEQPPKEWLARLGIYEITNARKILYASKADEDKNKLQNVNLTYDAIDRNLCFNGVSINAISSTEAVTRGFGRSAGETIRAYTENGEEYLWAWGYAFKKKSVPSK